MKRFLDWMLGFAAGATLLASCATRPAPAKDAGHCIEFVVVDAGVVSSPGF